MTTPKHLQKQQFFIRYQYFKLLLSLDPFKPEFTLSSSSTLQAANCCHNSRLVVDKDELKWVKK